MARRVMLNSAVLYGVFVTENSFNFGLLSLIKNEHARMVTFKAIGHKLGIELVNMVADALHDAIVADMKGRKFVKKSIVWHADQFKAEAWDIMLPFDCPFERFIQGTPADQAEETVFDRLSATGFTFRRVHVSRPTRIPQPGQEAEPRRRGAFYIHVSTNVPLQRAIHHPHNSAPPNAQKSSAYDCGRGFAATTPRGSLGAAAVRDHTLVYTPNATVDALDQDLPVKPQISRLTSVENVDKAMRHWHPEAFAKLVEVLNLLVVPTSDDGEAPMAPRLVIWDTVLDSF